VVVGGGIAGLATAVKLANSGHRVINVVRRGLPGIPTRTTQTNHGWIQSGLLYPRDPVLRHVPWASAGVLLRRYGHVPPASLPVNARGIFGFQTADMAVDDFMEAADALGWANLVTRLSAATVYRRLGDFAKGNDYVYFSVPDVPFDQGRLLSDLHRHGQALGVEQIEVERPVTLLRDGASIAVKFDNGVTTDPRSLVVLCAGGGTQELLEGTGLRLHDLTLHRSILALVVDPTFMPRCPLYVDRSRGLAFVRHGDVVVVGGAGRSETAEGWAVSPASAAEQQALRSQLGNLDDRWIATDSYRRWTVGIKAEIEVNGSPRVHPKVWNLADQGVSNLIVGVPGKATLADFLAELVDEEVSSHFSSGFTSDGCGTVPKEMLRETRPSPTDDEVMPHYSYPYAAPRSDESIDFRTQAN
jgi:glycine/D-amino acid oxidase-like deaminating enzyme